MTARNRAALVLVPALLPLCVQADWELNGSVHNRVEYYSVSGDETASPYKKEGTVGFGELTLGLQGESAPGVRWRMNFAGVLGDSPYRSDYLGLSPEVLSLHHENVAAAIPYEVKAGDFAESMSPLTFNGALKGLGIKLNPEAHESGRRFTFSAFAGRDGIDWREFERDEDLDEDFRGVSVGMQDKRLGSYRFNLVHGGANGEPGQWTAGLQGKWARNFERHGVKLEGELARVQERDADGSEANGYYLELTGKDKKLPLDYRMRYDRYGADFKPRGASVASDTEAAALEAGWTFQPGTRLSGRLQRVEDDVSTDNPVRTHSVGVGLTAPLGKKAGGKVDVVVQDRESALGNVDARSVSARLDLDLKQNRNHQSRFSLGYSSVDDFNIPGTERVTRQAGLSHKAQVKIGGLDLSLAPGLSYTESESQDASATFGPTLALEARRNRHQWLLSLGSSDFAGSNPLDEVYTSDLTFDYAYRHNKHILGFDLARSLREPALGEETESWRAGFYWRYEFGASSAS